MDIATSIYDFKIPNYYCPGAAKTERITATGTALKLIREKGIVGIYKGFRATALRDVTFSAIYFPLFAIFNEKVSYMHIRLVLDLIPNASFPLSWFVLPSSWT